MAIKTAPKTSFPIITANATETANIHSGTSTGITIGFNNPVTR